MAGEDRCPDAAAEGRNELIVGSAQVIPPAVGAPARNQANVRTDAGAARLPGKRTVVLHGQGPQGQVGGLLAEGGKRR
jgi:hypothetical protein